MTNRDWREFTKQNSIFELHRKMWTTKFTSLRRLFHFVDLFIYLFFSLFGVWLLCNSHAGGSGRTANTHMRMHNTWRFTHGCPLHMSINAALHTARRLYITPGPFRCVRVRRCMNVSLALQWRTNVYAKRLGRPAYSHRKTKERTYASAQRRETHWADTLVSQRWMSNKQI